MSVRRFMSAALQACTILLLFFSTAHADLYFESEQVSSGIPGQTDGKSVSKQYLCMDAAMMDMGAQIIIMDFNTRLIYDLDVRSRTYTRTRVEEFGPLGGGEAAGQKEMLEAMLDAVAGSMKVTPTENYKQILGHQCRRYVVSIMMASSECWAARDFQGYPEMKAIGKRLADFFSANPLLKQMNLLGLISELDGFPLQTATNIMGGRVTTIVTKLEQKKIDRGVFKVPSGYKLVRK